MAIANVQIVTGNGATVTLNSVASAALLTLQTAAFKVAGQGVTPTTPTDTQGTWADAINPPMVQFNTNDGVGTQIYYQENCASGTHTVTPYNGFGSHHHTLSEWSGALTSGSLDTHPAQVDDRTDHTSTQVTSTGTLAQADELSLAVCAIAASTGAPDVVWTNPVSTYTTSQINTNDATDVAGLAIYKIVSATTAEQPTFNWTAHETVMSTQAIIATFKAIVSVGVTLTLLGQACL